MLLAQGQTTTSTDNRSLQRRLWVRLHEKGRQVPRDACHHTLEGYLAEYMERARLAETGRVPPRFV